MITNTDHKPGSKITFAASGRIRDEVPVILQDRRDIRGRSLLVAVAAVAWPRSRAPVRSVTMP